jgi:hypothetical protein
MGASHKRAERMQMSNLGRDSRYDTQWTTCSKIFSSAERELVTGADCESKEKWEVWQSSSKHVLCPPACTHCLQGKNTAASWLSASVSPLRSRTVGQERVSPGPGACA